MPYLRKKYLRYTSYSNATIRDIFTAEQLKKASFYTADNMKSAVFINNGKGAFEQRSLPNEAQFFPVNGIQCMDLNKDGKLDLLLVGNDYSTEVETGRNDAGIGLALWRRPVSVRATRRHRRQGRNPSAGSWRALGMRAHICQRRTEAHSHQSHARTRQPKFTKRRLSQFFFSSLTTR